VLDEVTLAAADQVPPLDEVAVLDEVDPAVRCWPPLLDEVRAQPGLDLLSWRPGAYKGTTVPATRARMPDLHIIDLPALLAAYKYISAGRRAVIEGTGPSRCRPPGGNAMDLSVLTWLGSAVRAVGGKLY